MRKLFPPHHFRQWRYSARNPHGRKAVDSILPSVRRKDKRGRTPPPVRCRRKRGGRRQDNDSSRLRSARLCRCNGPVHRVVFSKTFPSLPATAAQLSRLSGETGRLGDIPVARWIATALVLPATVPTHVRGC